MVDFVGILKRAINAQSNVTLQVRKRIYERAIETLEHQFATAKVPQEIADGQRKILQSAIATVEEEYLALEKNSLSSVIGWNPTKSAKVNKYTQSSILQRDKTFSEMKTEERQVSITSAGDNKALDKSYVSVTPDAEPVNIDTYLASQRIDDNILKASPLASVSKGDNPYIVSHIFSQALRRANRSSMQKRIVITTAVIASLVILTIGIYFVCIRMFVLDDHLLSEENQQVSHPLPKAFSVNKKLTKRLLEDGREVDVGLNQAANSSHKEGNSTVVSRSLQPFEKRGEAIFYQARTNYEAEKVATGSAHWTLIKESREKEGEEESTIQGDITIPDEGLSLRLILRRNTDVSFPAAYIMDLIFISSDKFSGQAISKVQAFTFKASEQSIGQAFTRAIAAKIDDNLFLVALSGNQPFLERNLQLMRELDWIRVVLTDKNGRISELTFTKGQIGKSIFNEVIGQWLTQPDKRTILGQEK
ncbi:hypothetical protein [Bartonella harrusi]|uniref:Transmembrane protein n=1 Tax=Bartonella harrusi TaxID=2961895 RepID=A0ABY5EXA1_9HYPH|nr:hypothetical protein [Bartonella harrusi]UTO28745.1 hypothetical protein NMK50_01635 [Bartonella harrusi]